MSGVDIDEANTERGSRCIGNLSARVPPGRGRWNHSPQGALRWLLPTTNAFGVIHLKDIVKGGLRDRFERFRAMGIKTVMITGDNRLTAAAIAREAGVDDFLAEADPRTNWR